MYPEPLDILSSRKFVSHSLRCSQQAYTSSTLEPRGCPEMPRVEINMVEGDHSVSQKLAFMKKATEVVVRILNCPPEDASVIIVDSSFSTMPKHFDYGLGQFLSAMSRLLT